MKNFLSLYKRGDGAIAITTGASDADPNGTDPNAHADSLARPFVTPNTFSEGAGAVGALWLWCVGAAPTVTVYVYDETSSRWYPVQSGVALSLTGVTKVTVPANAKVFIGITAVNASTRIVAGWGPG